MQTSHLNVFVPYENKPLHHEDQLTRAFLILLRSIKLVEQLFIELLRERMHDSGITALPDSLYSAAGGVDSVESQVWSSTKHRLEGESGRLVSVILTDELLEPEHRVTRSPRLAVYDGFLKLRPNWTVVLENKPDHNNIWVDQLSSAFNEDYEIEPTPVVITWSEIIRRLGLLITNSLVHDAARALVEDFLNYVTAYFPELNPYDTFGLCSEHTHLVEKHCVAIMTQASLGPVEYHRGWYHSIRLSHKPGIKEVSLHSNTETDSPWPLSLDLHPGDTMNQARALYQTLNIHRLLATQTSGWNITPNFHIAFSSSNLHWATTDISLQQYVEYWISIIKSNSLSQVPRDNWPQYFKSLSASGIIAPHDIEQIHELLSPTAMSTINVCPGLSFHYSWNRDQATTLEDEGRFCPVFVSKVEEVLDLW